MTIKLNSKLALVLCGLLIGGVSTKLAGAIYGFTVHTIEFDRSVQGAASVHIPKTWRMTGVSPTAASNQSVLWFQDEDGAVYGVTGFYDSGSGEFILKGQINKLEVQP